MVLHQVTSDVVRLADGPDEADDAPAHSLALDFLRPRGTVAFVRDTGAPVGAIAERGYSLYRENLTFDCGTAKRVQMGNQAAGDELARLQFEAFDLMDQAMDFPAASLTDVVALLDFALSEVDGLGAVVEDDPTADARLDAIRRVLHGTCRVVATVVGINRHELVWALPRMDRVVFPDRVMPPVVQPADTGSSVSLEPDAEIIATCADGLAAWDEQARASRADDEAAADAAYDRGSVALDRIMAGPLPVTPAGLAAVARLTIASTSCSLSDEPLDMEVCHSGEHMAWRLVQLMAGVPADRVQLLCSREAREQQPEGDTGIPVSVALAAVAADTTTAAPTFALIATEALRLGRQIQAMESQGHDEPTSPFYTAYFGFSRAALSYKPASLAETMTLAAFVKEQAATVATATLTEERSTEIGKTMDAALANVVRGIHRFGGVPMSAAEPALDYLGGTAEAGL